MSKTPADLAQEIMEAVPRADTMRGVLSALPERSQKVLEAARLLVASGKLSVSVAAYARQLVSSLELPVSQEKLRRWLRGE